MKTNKNGVKLLAFIAVLAIAFAGITVVFSSDDSTATPVVPTENPFKGMAGDKNDSNMTLSGKTLTIKDNVTITLTKDIGSADSPLDMNIVIENEKTLTITSTSEYKVYITFVPETHVEAQNGTIYSGATGGLTVSGKVVMELGIDASKTKENNGHVLNIKTLTTTGDAKVTLKNVNNTQGIAFLDIDNGNPALIMSGTSQIIFDSAGGMSNVSATMSDTAKIEVKNTVVSGYTFKSLTMASGNIIKVSGGDVDERKGYIQLNNTTSTIDGTIDAADSQLRIKDDSTVTVGASGSLKVKEVVIFAAANSEDANAKISGKLIGAELSKAIVSYPYSELSYSPVYDVTGLVTDSDGISVAAGVTVDADNAKVEPTVGATILWDGTSTIVKLKAGTSNTNALNQIINLKTSVTGSGSTGTWKLEKTSSGDNSNPLAGNVSAGTVTLTNYVGSEAFNGAFTKVVVSGTNVISIDISKNATANTPAIWSKADILTIEGNSRADKLTINFTANPSTEYGAISATDSILGGNASTYNGLIIQKIDLTIYADATTSTGSADKTRGITSAALTITNSKVQAYAGSTGINVANSILIDGSSSVTAAGYEKGIRVWNEGESMTVGTTPVNGVISDRSTVEAYLLDGKGVNGTLTDERFGIKVGPIITVHDGSSVITQGFSTAGKQTAQAGKVIVYGDYEPHQKTGSIMVAGLVLRGTLTAPLEVKEIEDSTKAVAGFNIIEGTDTYGKISLIPLGSESAITQDVISGSGEVSNTDIAGKGQVVVTGSATLGAVTITRDQKVIVTDGIDIKDGVKIEGNGILEVQAIGTGLTKTFTVGEKSVSFNGFKGIIQISVGSIVVDGMEMSGNLEVVEDGTTVKLSGSIAAGKNVTIRLTGATTTGTVLVLEDKTLTIPQNSKLILENGIKMSNDGQIVGGGTIDVAEKAQFYTSNPVSVNFTGTGKIILEDATETLKLSDKLASSMTTEPTQKVIITGNLTIKENQYLVITGDLEIPQGVTVTIENGGQLRLTSPTATATIAGTIKSLGVYTNGDAGFKIDDTVTKDVIITGEIIVGKTVEDKTTVDIKGYAYLEGTITVNAKTVANFEKLEVAEAGVVTVKGTIKGEIYNQGTVVIDGAVDDATIYNQAVTAVVEIDSLSSGTLTVSDAGLYLQTIETQRYYVAGTGVFNPNAYDSEWKISENAIDFNNVEGIIITESIKYKTVDDERLAVNHMEIQGAVTVSNVKDNSEYYPILTVAKGTVDVIETLDVSKAQVSISRGAALVVYGTVNLDDSDMPNGITHRANEIEITVSGSLYVYGLVHCIDIPVNKIGYVEAVAYEVKEGTKTIYNYTNLADAIASGVKDLEVLGDLTILKDTTIPKGIEIDAAGSDVKVGTSDNTEVTLTVADGGYLAFNKVNVIGTFVIENTDDGVNKMTNITSDTSVISENTAMYTNLLNALNNAESGEVRITKIGDDPVTLGANATVKKDVTLVVPSSKKLSIVNGVTLTIDGTLKLDGGMITEKAPTATGDAHRFNTVTSEPTNPSYLYSVVKVNGTIISQDVLDYNTYYIPGAQFDYKTKHYLTTIEQAAPLIKTVDASTIKIYGENKVGTVAFEGTSVMPAAVKVYGNITAESFTIAFGEIYIDDGVAIEGTFGSSVGTITVKNMKVSVSLSMTDTVVTISDEEVQKVYMKGTVYTNKTDVAPSLTFNGKVEISKSIFGVDASYDDTKFGSVTVDEDATVVISGNDGSLATGSTTAKTKITVNGTLVTTNNGSVLSNIIVVMGTLDVKEAQGSVAAGSIYVDNLYIGGTTTDVKAVGGAAAVNAPVSGVGLVYLFPGSTVTGTLAVELESDDVKYTEFYVEDVLWLTVYKISSSSVVNIVEIDDRETTYYFKPLTIKEKEFVSWQYISDGKLTNFSNTTALGDKDKVYADIKYDVYNVTVYACEGIDDVFIDGDIMVFSTISTNGGYTGLFSADVVAGEHTITYTLTNGYSGTAIMSVNGDKATGYKFTAGGDFSLTDGKVEYSITLQGIEKSGYVPDTPEPTPVEPTEKDDSLGITEYLLIVLVVLAAILVVVVAIRMMRS